MPIKRNSEQLKRANMSLRDFYTHHIGADLPYSGAGKKMLILIDLINDIFKDTIIYGLTSHVDLILHKEDGLNLNGFVKIGFRSDSSNDYFINCLNSSGQTSDCVIKDPESKELERELLNAMVLSNCWPNNEELILRK